MKLTFYGLKEWLSAAAVTLALVLVLIALGVVFNIAWTNILAVCLLLVLIWVAFAAFFRDPQRTITTSETAVVSPADGVVRDIELIKGGTCDSEVLKKLFEGKDMLRIGIFLSVLDVHLNRAPLPMQVSAKFYKEGAFHDARDPRAGKENESMLIGGIASSGSIRFPIAVRQISGAIARRIVCPVQIGDCLERGQKFGMIKFGSRTELYLPAAKCFDIHVKVGDRVFGGTSIMADLLPEVARESKTLLAFSAEEAQAAKAIAAAARGEDSGSQA